MNTLLLSSILVALFTAFACTTPQNVPAKGELDLITLPEGFSISVFAKKVKNPRSLALGDNGTIFVGTRGEGSVYALVDEDGDFKADKVHEIAKDLFMPNGVAFKNGALYVAEVNRIIKFDNIESQLDNPPTPTVIFDKYPSKTHHGWKYIAFGPDDKLYVPVGAPCNVCEKEVDFSATMTRMNADGSDVEIIAEGIRNSVGFDWHPQTNELYFTDNGRDYLGNDFPPDELNKLSFIGEHFGFPHCHGGFIADPKFANDRKCEEFTKPIQNLLPHTASLGVEFYNGTMFPEEYRNKVLICEHGSWNRDEPQGYRISAVTLEDGKSTKYEAFAEGWLQAGEAWGRPVDLLELPDGSLLVSDDKGDKIYRITYSH